MLNAMRAALAYLDHVVGKACQIIEVFFLQRFPEPAVGVKSENSRERRLGLDTSCDVKFLCKTVLGCLSELNLLTFLQVTCHFIVRERKHGCWALWNVLVYLIIVSFGEHAGTSPWRMRIW